MSVEKVSPLGRASIEPSARANGPVSVAPALRPILASAGAPSPRAGESPTQFFDSLALPLPVATGNESGVAASFVQASYAREAARPGLAILIDGRLPEAAIHREVLSSLRLSAQERGQSLGRFIAGVDAVDDARLPAHNGAQAEYSLRARLPARDETGEIRLFDLFLTRAGPRDWEVAVFRRAESGEFPGFPLPGPPTDVYRLDLDAGAGQILACVAQQIAPRAFAAEQAANLEEALRAVLLFVATIFAAYMIA
jgi:hypothetical protein